MYDAILDDDSISLEARGLAIVLLLRPHFLDEAKRSIFFSQANKTVPPVIFVDPTYTLSENPKKAKSNETRGQRLEKYLGAIGWEDFNLSHGPLPNGWEDFCQDLGCGSRAREIFETFRDYWSAQPGAKGVKCDWPATWRNWCRKQNTSKGSGSYGSPSKQATVASAVLADRLGQAGMDGRGTGRGAENPDTGSDGGGLPFVEALR